MGTNQATKISFSVLYFCYGGVRCVKCVKYVAWLIETRVWLHSLSLIRIRKVKTRPGYWMMFESLLLTAKELISRTKRAKIIISFLCRHWSVTSFGCCHQDIISKIQICYCFVCCDKIISVLGAWKKVFLIGPQRNASPSQGYLEYYTAAKIIPHAKTERAKLYQRKPRVVSHSDKVQTRHQAVFVRSL